MNKLCTIAMRGGSKGVQNKNLKNMNGKPLMYYTIQQALNCELFDRVVVSTDSKEISSSAQSFGADAWFIRPSELATDEAAKIPVIRHALIEAEKYYNQKFDLIIDLDATSPLRNIFDIQEAYKQFLNEDADILLTACRSRKNPYFNMVESINGKIKLVKKIEKAPVRRQDAPQTFDMNASIYIWKRNILLKNNSLFTEKTSLYIMPEERSIDIDNKLDWDFVEYYMNKSL